MQVSFAKTIVSIRDKLPIVARWIVVVAVSVNAIRAVQGDDAAADSLQDGCQKLARRVRQIIDAEKLEKTVAVGAFSGVPRLESSGGVGLAQRVREALEAEGVTVKRRAACQLSGEFRDGMALSQRLNTEMVTLRVEYAVRDADDRILAQGVVNMFGDAPLEIAGGTFQHKITVPPEVDGRRLAASFRDPSAAVDGNLTRPAAQSPFGLGVIVTRGRAAGPKIPQVRDGRAFVQLDRGEEYAVNLQNNSAEEVLVSLTIDGLDAFTFSEEGAKPGRKAHFVLAPRSSYRVPGWFITRQKTLAFKTTGYAESEAAKLLGDSESIGQITATYYKSITVEMTTSSSSSSRLGTGKGSQVATDYRSVAREEGPPLATITVRYEKAP